MSDKFYITTAIDYTNDVVHIGHSYQKILADCLARYHRIRQDKTFFLTGSDEHGQKVQKAAEKAGKSPQEFVDEISEKDKKEWKLLNISYDRFIRTTDSDHIDFVKEIYLKIKKNGDIYPSCYEGLYCEGCEAYLTEKELEDGKCPLHPTKSPLKISEENYFFTLSKYQKFLLDYISSHPDFIVPESKKNEVVSFIKEGLEDFSISRKNVSWGIPLPDDPSQVIYVWLDALTNYLTYGSQNNCWPADVHVLGKDNLRFHAIYWPAFLKSAGYPLPKTILVHDYIFLNNQKISKSLGNVIAPSELVEKFSTDGVRYYFLRYGPLRSDVDITLEKIKDVYNADLANGLGNLFSRTVKLLEISGIKNLKLNKNKFDKKISDLLDLYRPDLALTEIWKEIDALNLLINKNILWKDTLKKQSILKDIIQRLYSLSENLLPFLPQTAEKIQNGLLDNNGSKEILFPRVK